VFPARCQSWTVSAQARTARILTSVRVHKELRMSPRGRIYCRSTPASTRHRLRCSASRVPLCG
jgi:hypothetical protein